MSPVPQWIDKLTICQLIHYNGEMNGLARNSNGQCTNFSYRHYIALKLNKYFAIEYEMGKLCECGVQCAPPRVQTHLDLSQTEPKIVENVRNVQKNVSQRTQKSFSRFFFENLHGTQQITYKCSMEALQSSTGHKIHATRHCKWMEKI